MPVARKKLDMNVRISVNKHFVKGKDALEILKGKYDWNTPRLNFVEKTIGRVSNENKEMYEVFLDEAPAITLTIAARSLKYLGRSSTERNTMDNAIQKGVQSAANDEVFEDLLEDAIQEESCDEVDLINTDGWQAGEVFHDNRIVQNNSFKSEKAFLYMISPKNKSPCDCFLHFLPMDQFIIIIGERRFRDDSDRIVTVKRPEVFEEYETHKSKKNK
jgi:hypothetical protein